MSSKEKKIIIAGFGGQGIVLAGNLIARACIFENKYVTGMVAYGAEMRGGTANATIVISDEEIASPVVEVPDIGIILNQPSLDRYEDDMAKDGLMILNSSLVKRELETQRLVQCKNGCNAFGRRAWQCQGGKYCCTWRVCKKNRAAETRKYCPGHR